MVNTQHSTQEPLPLMLQQVVAHCGIWLSVAKTEVGLMFTDGAAMGGNILELNVSDFLYSIATKQFALITEEVFMWVLFDLNY